MVTDTWDADMEKPLGWTFEHLTPKGVVTGQWCQIWSLQLKYPVSGYRSIIII